MHDAKKIAICPDAYRAALSRRGVEGGVVDRIASLYQERGTTVSALDAERGNRNQRSREIGEKMRPTWCHTLNGSGLATGRALLPGGLS